MKKTIFRFVQLLLTLFIAAAIAGCSGAEQEKVLPEITADDLVGTWVYMSDDGGQISYHFNQNNMYVRTDYIGGQIRNETGYFSVVDNNLCCFAEENKDFEHVITDYGENTITWKDKTYGEMKFIKQ